MKWPTARRAVAAAALIGTAIVVAAGDAPVATAGRMWLVMLLHGAQVLLLVGAGLLAVGPRPALTVVATAAALATVGLGFVGRPGRLEAASTIAVALVVPLLLLLVVLVVQLPGRSARGRGPTLALTVAIAVAIVARVLVYDPFSDVDCVGLCRPNLILVDDDLELARRLGSLAALAVALLAGSMAWQAVRSWPRGWLSRSRPRTGELLAVTAALLLGVDRAVRLAAGTVAVPGDTSPSVLAVELAAAALVGGALVAAAVGPLRARWDVDRVVRLLARADGVADVQTILRDAFGDPRLTVGYWADGAGYLDAGGDRIDTSRGARTELTNRGSPVALVVHGRDSVSGQLFARQLRPQARLAVHNEALMVELRRHAEDLAWSRRRIVEASESERRRLERDLHDGAQQSVLALLFELRHGGRAAEAIDDERSAAAFGRANSLVLTALDQLRELAHGIHPAFFAGTGLRDALSDLAARSGCAVSTTIENTGPVPLSLQTTVYRVVAAAVAGASDADALHVIARSEGEAIVLRIDGMSELCQTAADRAAAVGATQRTTATGVEVTVPCAS